MKELFVARGLTLPGVGDTRGFLTLVILALNLPRVGECTIGSATEKPCQDLVTLVVGLAWKPFQ
jgi:hypothetical protein